MRPAVQKTHAPRTPTTTNGHPYRYRTPLTQPEKYPQAISLGKLQGPSKFAIAEPANPSDDEWAARPRNTPHASTPNAAALEGRCRRSPPADGPPDPAALRRGSRECPRCRTPIRLRQVAGCLQAAAQEDDTEEAGSEADGWYVITQYMVSRRRSRRGETAIEPFGRVLLTFPHTSQTSMSSPATSSTSSAAPSGGPARTASWAATTRSTPWPRAT